MSLYDKADMSFEFVEFTFMEFCFLVVLGTEDRLQQLDDYM